MSSARRTAPVNDQPYAANTKMAERTDRPPGTPPSLTTVVHAESTIVTSFTTVVTPWTMPDHRWHAKLAPKPPKRQDADAQPPPPEPPQGWGQGGQRAGPVALYSPRGRVAR